MTAREIAEGLRDGTLSFCLPLTHEEFTTAFLDDFSRRILGRDWREVCVSSRVPSLLDDEDAEEDEIVAAIDTTYGVDVSDLPGLPLWEVVRRCARGGKAGDGASNEE